MLSQQIFFPTATLCHPILNHTPTIFLFAILLAATTAAVLPTIKLCAPKLRSRNLLRHPQLQRSGFLGSLVRTESGQGAHPARCQIDSLGQWERSYVYTKIEGLVINLYKGRKGGKYTSFCGVGTEPGGGGAIWSGADAQVANMPKQCTTM